MYMSHIYAKKEEHPQLSRAYRSKRGIHICKEVFGRHYQARGAYRELIGSHQEPSRATDRVIKSTDRVIGSHREQQTELLGEQIELSGAIGSRTHIDISIYVIGLVKPMYAFFNMCFNTIGGANRG